MFGKSCYSLLRHSCDGRCQGCSDCPFAEAFHEDSPVGSVSRFRMLKFEISSAIKRWWWDRWAKKHSAEIAEAIADSLQQIKNKSLSEEGG